jgi:hypothetical protein
MWPFSETNAAAMRALKPRLALDRLGRRERVSLFEFDHAG